MITVFVGSNLPKLGDLRRSVLCEVMEDVGISPTFPIIDKSPFLYGDPRKIAKEFLSTIRCAQSTDIVIIADGGTGAARVMYHLFVERDRTIVVPSCTVQGYSDACLYPMYAFVVENMKRCFYGPNFIDEDFVPDVEEVEAHIEFDTAESNWAPPDTPYKLFPACTRPLLQVPGLFYDQIIEYFKINRVLLMLEDNYPEGESGDIAFYEDLTSLLPYLQAVELGGGAVTFSSDSLEAVKLYCTSMNISVPFFVNVKFGHSDMCVAPLQYGQEVILDYNYLRGLSVRPVDGE